MLQLKKDSLSSRLQIIAWDSAVKTIVLNADATDSVKPQAHTSSSNTAVLKLYDTSSHNFNRTFAFMFKSKEEFDNFCQIITTFQKSRDIYLKDHAVKNRELFEDVEKDKEDNKEDNEEDNEEDDEEDNKEDDEEDDEEEYEDSYDEPATQNFPQDHDVWYPESCSYSDDGASKSE